MGSRYIRISRQPSPDNASTHLLGIVKKEIVRGLQHRAKIMSSGADTYRQEMINLKRASHENNNYER